MVQPRAPNPTNNYVTSQIFIITYDMKGIHIGFPTFMPTISKLEESRTSTVGQSVVGEGVG